MPEVLPVELIGRAVSTKNPKASGFGGSPQTTSIRCSIVTSRGTPRIAMLTATAYLLDLSNDQCQVVFWRAVAKSFDMIQEAIRHIEYVGRARDGGHTDQPIEAERFAL